MGESLGSVILRCPVQYKDRVDMSLIRPAVDWRKTPVGSGTMGAAVAKS